MSGKGLDYWIKVARPALDNSFNLGGDPSSVKVSRLCLDLLPVHVAVPRPGVEGKVALDGLKAGRRIVVRPDPIGDRLIVAALHGVVRCGAFPFTIGLPAGRLQRDLERRGREVVCYVISSEGLLA